MSDWLTSELPTRRSDRVLVWDRPLANWAMLEAALVIVFLFTVLSLGAWGVLGRSPWTLSAAWLAVSGLAVWRLVEHVRWRGTYVVFGHNSVRILRSERLVDEIPYGAISGYTLEPGKEQLLTIERSDGEPPWVTPGSIFGFDAGRTVVAQLGPRLPKTASQNRGERPEGVLAGFIWDHYGAPPPVRMEAGVRYRYRSPEELRGLAEIPVLIAALALLSIVIFSSLLSFARSPFFHLIRPTCVLAIVAIWSAFILVFVRITRFRDSLYDRFEWTPEGLKITRGKRSWMLSPAPSTRQWATFNVAGEPLRRFGRGSQTYYFDPRFIERDE